METKKKCQIDSEAWDSVKWAIICDREKYVNRQCPLYNQQKHHFKKCKHEFDVSRALAFKELGKKENSFESFKWMAYNDNRIFNIGKYTRENV